MKAEISLERITWHSAMSILLGIADIRILNERGISWTINKIGGKVVIPVDEDHQSDSDFVCFNVIRLKLEHEIRTTLFPAEFRVT